jgi:hypothetical protein
MKSGFLILYHRLRQKPDVTVQMQSVMGIILKVLNVVMNVQNIIVSIIKMMLYDGHHLQRWIRYAMQYTIRKIQILVEVVAVAVAEEIEVEAQHDKTKQIEKPKNEYNKEENVTSNLFDICVSNHHGEFLWVQTL